LRAGLVTGAGAIAGAVFARPAFGAPALLRARPAVTHGVQAGDVNAESGVVWARADGPARMLVEVPRGNSFSGPAFSGSLLSGPSLRAPSSRGSGGGRGPAVPAASDFTGKVRVQGLPAGSDVPYRVFFADLDDESLTGEPVAGSF